MRYDRSMRSAKGGCDLGLTAGLAAAEFSTTLGAGAAEGAFLLAVGADGVGVSLDRVRWQIGDAAAS